MQKSAKFSVSISYSIYSLCAFCISRDYYSVSSSGAPHAIPRISYKRFIRHFPSFSAPIIFYLVISSATGSSRFDQHAFNFVCIKLIMCPLSRPKETLIINILLYAIFAYQLRAIRKNQLLTRPRIVYNSQIKFNFRWQHDFFSKISLSRRIEIGTNIKIHF